MTHVISSALCCIATVATYNDLEGTGFRFNTWKFLLNAEVISNAWKEETNSWDFVPFLPSLLFSSLLAFTDFAPANPRAHWWTIVRYLARGGMRHHHRQMALCQSAVHIQLLRLSSSPEYDAFRADCRWGIEMNKRSKSYPDSFVAHLREWSAKAEEKECVPDEYKDAWRRITKRLGLAELAWLFPFGMRLNGGREKTSLPGMISYNKRVTACYYSKPFFLLKSLIKSLFSIYGVGG